MAVHGNVTQKRTRTLDPQDKIIPILYGVRCPSKCHVPRPTALIKGFFGTCWFLPETQGTHRLRSQALLLDCDRLPLPGTPALQAFPAVCSHSELSHLGSLVSSPDTKPRADSQQGHCVYVDRRMQSEGFPVHVHTHSHTHLGQSQQGWLSHAARPQLKWGQGGSAAPFPDPPLLWEVLFLSLCLSDSVSPSALFLLRATACCPGPVARAPSSTDLQVRTSGFQTCHPGQVTSPL